MKNLIGNILLLISLAGCAQANKVASTENLNDSMPPKYDVAVKFNSICCGPASDDFLKSFVRNFCQKNNSSVAGFHKGSCGREGEYAVLFALSSMNEKLKQAFISELEPIVAKQNTENKSTQAQKGPIRILSTGIEESIQHCRSEITSWEYGRH